MLRRMHRLGFAFALCTLAGCPADDAWMDSLEDSGSGETGESMTASASATNTASASATMTASGTDSGTGTGTESGSETDPDGTASDDAASSDGTTAADSTTGTGECAEGLETSLFSDVDGCDEVVGEPFCSEGQMHVPLDSDVDWDSDPPNSGPHYPTWEAWGEHPATVPRGYWVHNLEHGGVVLSYRCNDDCETEVEVLRDVMAARPDLRILLTPDPLLPGDERFAAISWTWIHRFDAPDLETLLCFVDQHENHAPEDVP